METRFDILDMTKDGEEVAEIADVPEAAITGITIDGCWSRNEDERQMFMTIVSNKFPVAEVLQRAVCLASTDGRHINQPQ